MMTLIRALIALTRPFSRHMSPCQLNGVLIGAITGAIFAIVWMTGQEASPSFVPVSFPVWLQIALLLAAFCWAVLFALLCGPLRYPPSSVAGPLLVNAVLTAVLTVDVCNVVGTPTIFFAIGIAAGYAVGSLLCTYCHGLPGTGREG